MALIIDNLEKAIASLEKAMELTGSPAAEDPEMLRALQDSVIQRFEHTYELAFKLLKRQLESMSANPHEFEAMSFRDVVRRGGEAGITPDVEAFMRYRDARNITSHSYDEDRAQDVLEVVPDFIGDARAMLEKLKELNPEEHD